LDVVGNDVQGDHVRRGSFGAGPERLGEHRHQSVATSRVGEHDVVGWPGRHRLDSPVGGFHEGGESARQHGNCTDRISTNAGRHRAELLGDPRHDLVGRRGRDDAHRPDQVRVSRRQGESHPTARRPAHDCGRTDVECEERTREVVREAVDGGHGLGDPRRRPVTGPVHGQQADAGLGGRLRIGVEAS
jgi:hypothetical protein